MEKQDNDIIFREVQYFRQAGVWILVLGIAGLIWYSAIQQIVFRNPIGSNPASDVFIVILWLVFGILFPVFMLRLCKLITEVRLDGIYIRFCPFHFKFKFFPVKDITSYSAIAYSPIKRFGGWGIRFNMDGEKAYNISGKQGIDLKLGNKTIVIGTKKPDKLIEALDSIVMYK